MDKNDKQDKLIRAIADVVVAGAVFLVVFGGLFYLERIFFRWVSLDIWKWGEFYLASGGSDNPKDFFLISWGRNFDSYC